MLVSVYLSVLNVAHIAIHHGRAPLSGNLEIVTLVTEVMQPLFNVHSSITQGEFVSVINETVKNHTVPSYQV